MYAAAVALRSASLPHADRRCEYAALPVRLGCIQSSAEITSCVRICGSRDVVSWPRVDELRIIMIGGRREFGGLGLRGGYIAMVMLGERETCGRRWRERLRAHVMEWGGQDLC